MNKQGPDRKDETSSSVEAGCPQFPETEEQLHVRCRTTIHKLLKTIPKNESIIIVGHAPCVQSMAMALEGSTTPKETQLGPWSLGGMTLFSRTINNDDKSKWTLEFYSDTSHMPGEYKHGKLGQWSLPSWTTNVISNPTSNTTDVSSSSKKKNNNDKDQSELALI